MPRGSATTATRDPILPETVDGVQALGLVSQLCAALREADVRYCHWKSTTALDRSARGDNDLDLLVDRSDVPRFVEILQRLGLKEARGPSWSRIPGIVDYHGLDRASGRLVHVHAHYRMVVGDDMTKNYHLPIERAYLSSSMQGPLFRVPAPEFELAVLVIRLILKHASWDSFLNLQARLSTGERAELDDLSRRADPIAVRELVAEHLPFVGVEVFDRCLRAVRQGGALRRVVAGWRMHRGLAAHSRRPMPWDAILKVVRRVARKARRYVLRQKGHRLVAGGSIVAVVGADGSGKSTMIEELRRWLAPHLSTVRVHLGKPPLSVSTLAVRVVLLMRRLLRLPSIPVSPDGALGPSPSRIASYAWLFRQWSLARDRRRAYVGARRAAARGDVVLCDRFPLPDILLMDGPKGPRFPSGLGRLERFLVERERRCYADIQGPDILVVLRVDPEVAMARRDEGDGDVVRARSGEVSRADWTGRDALVVDTARSMGDLLTEIRSFIWSRL